MKTFLSACAALIAFASLSFLTPAEADPTAGQCAMVGGVLNTVLGPSNLPGEYMTRDARLHAGGGQSQPVGNIHIVPCTAAQPKHTCFASDPDKGQNAIDWAIRHYLATNYAHQVNPQTTHFRSVWFGQSRYATTPEQVDFGDGDFSAKVIDAKVAYDTCWDDGATIRVTHFNRYFLCFTSKSTRSFACGIKAAVDMTDDTIDQTPKY